MNLSHWKIGVTAVSSEDWTTDGEHESDVIQVPEDMATKNFVAEAKVADFYAEIKSASFFLFPEKN